MTGARRIRVITRTTVGEILEGFFPENLRTEFLGMSRDLDWQMNNQLEEHGRLEFVLERRDLRCVVAVVDRPDPHVVYFAPNDYTYPYVEFHAHNGKHKSSLNFGDHRYNQWDTSTANGQMHRTYFNSGANSGAECKRLIESVEQMHRIADRVQQFLPALHHVLLVPDNSHRSEIGFQISNPQKRSSYLFKVHFNDDRNVIPTYQFPKEVDFPPVLKGGDQGVFKLSALAGVTETAFTEDWVHVNALDIRTPEKMETFRRTGQNMGPNIQIVHLEKGAFSSYHAGDYHVQLFGRTVRHYLEQDELIHVVYPFEIRRAKIGWSASSGEGVQSRALPMVHPDDQPAVPVPGVSTRQFRATLEAQKKHYLK